MPILCSRPRTWAPLRAPRLPSASTRNFGTRNRLRPLVPRPAFGVRASTLVETIRALVARFPLAGAGITEFAPASPDDAVEDMPTILRLIGALT